MAKFRNRCPYCGGQLKIRASAQLHDFMHRSYVRCQNEACGFSAAYRFEIDHVLTLSSVHRPDLNAQVRIANQQQRREAHRSYFGSSPSGQLDLVDALEA
jgi:hypothetical protein